MRPALHHDPREVPPEGAVGGYFGGPQARAGRARFCGRPGYVRAIVFVFDLSGKRDRILHRHSNFDVEANGQPSNSSASTGRSKRRDGIRWVLDDVSD